jgi:hypothetical protein
LPNGSAEVDEQKEFMTRFWKIAPGSNAEDWSLFQRHKCIGIGWLEDLDFRSFTSEDDVLTSLEARYGKNADGCGRGAAEMIWWFTREIKRNDVVVANDAYNRVVGIGTIVSNYIAPHSRSNPLRHDQNTHRHHVRMVDWKARSAVDIPASPPKQYFFVQQTLKELASDDLPSIANAYSHTFPRESRLVKQVYRLLEIETPASDRVKSTDWELHLAAAVGKEGERKLALHLVIERDPKIVKAKKLTAANLDCEVCGFSSLEFYGVPYCEVHHRKPLSQLSEGCVTTLQDLAIVCANCHRIIHSQFPPMATEDLAARLSKKKSK